MNSREFVKSTIMTMNKNSFGILKKQLLVNIYSFL